MRLILPISVLLLFGLAPGSRAQAFTAQELDDNGNNLLLWCKTGDITSPSANAKSATLLGLCDGYILGIADTLQFLELIDRPEEASKQQAVDIVVKYLNDHPETRHKPAHYLVMMALGGAWPRTTKPGQMKKK
jgi:hypothetical protein